MNLNQRRSFVSGNLVFPESPRWHEGELWFSDLLMGRIMKADAAGNVKVIAQAAGWLSGIGWLPSGQLIVVAMQARKLLMLEGNQLSEVTDLAPLTTMHTNDMVVDARGRAYIGEVGFDLHGGAPFKGANIVMVAPGAQPVVVASGLACPNGMVITADGNTLIVAESLGDRLTAFDIEEDGALTNQRIWASIEGLGPDGICLDAEGAIWAGCPFVQEVIRVLPGGTITDRFSTEILPLACMLGGHDGKQLFICRAHHPDEAVNTQSGGCIDVLEVDVPGAGLP